MNEKLDSQSSLKRKSLKDALLMKTFVKDVGIVDVWRTLNPTRRDYTHLSSATGQHSRLDYFFMFSKDLLLVEKIKIGQMYLSDHAPLQMT